MAGDALSYGANATVAALTATGAVKFTTLTGLLLGNGASAISVASPGTDYVAPGTATNFTAKQTFTGTASNYAMKLLSAIEKVTISATAATGTINYDVSTQSVLYYTSSAAATWVVNLRCSSGTTMDTALATGESITVAFLVTQGATPYYNTSVQVDGTVTGVTTKWLGAAPVAGVASGVDIYSYVVVKTGSATFTVFASLASFS